MLGAHSCTSSEFFFKSNDIIKNISLCFEQLQMYMMSHCRFLQNAMVSLVIHAGINLQIQSVIETKITQKVSLPTVPVRSFAEL